MVGPDSPHAGGPVRVDVDPLLLPRPQLRPAHWPAVHQDTLPWTMGHIPTLHEHLSSHLPPDGVGAKREPVRRESGDSGAVELGRLASVLLGTHNDFVH